MPSVLVLALLAVAALVTSFISGILGMAGGMILMGILLAVLPLPAAMMLHGITQLASNAWRAFLWRTQVDWRGFPRHPLGGPPPPPGVVPGELGGGQTAPPLLMGAP